MSLTRKPLAICCLCDATFSLQARGARIWVLCAAPPKQARARAENTARHLGTTGPAGPRSSRSACRADAGCYVGQAHLLLGLGLSGCERSMSESMGTWAAHQRCEEGGASPYHERFRAGSAPEQQRPTTRPAAGRDSAVTPCPSRSGRKSRSRRARVDATSYVFVT